MSLYSSTRNDAPCAGVDDGVAGAARCAWTGGRSGGVPQRLRLVGCCAVTGALTTAGHDCVAGWRGRSCSWCACAGPGRGPQQAVWRDTAVLRRLWPPSPCLGSAPCGLRLVAGARGWCCCCGNAPHAALLVAACNRGPPSSASASTSGLSRHVLPRRLWQVIGWVGFLSDVICGVESTLWEGCYPASALAHGVCVLVYV